MRCQAKDCWKSGVWICQSCCNKYHRLGSLNNRDARSLSFGSQKSEIKVWAGLVLSEAVICFRLPSQHLVVCWPSLGLFGL